MRTLLIALTLSLTVILQGCSSQTSSLSPAATRVSVIRNALSPTPTHFAFTYNDKDAIPVKGLVMATSNDQGVTWSSWSSPKANTTFPLTSNPVAISGPLNGQSVIFVFMQNPNGQILALVQNTSHPTQFDLKFQSTDLPARPNSAHQSSDPVQLVSLKNKTFVFVRTLSNTSELYWNHFNASLNFLDKWRRAGDSDNHLYSDPFAAVNTFLGRIEVFAVFLDRHVRQTWQDSEKSFHDGWEKLGGLFSPKFDSAPVVHQMGHSDFNGVLNLFVRGEDGDMHHISQTTCDKVKNSWGPCTWTMFHRVGDTPPSDPKVTSPFTITHSIHQGIEVFTVGKDKGHLYHVWQKERDSSYSNWDNLGPLSDSSPFLSSPALVIDDFGWWEAFALDSSHSITKFVEKPLKFALSTDRVEFDKNVTVTWAIPKDQATHMDWIGVYPQGAPGHGYVDFSYVGGTQNPLKDPVPSGTLQFRNTLPNGTYDYRYMVNKQYNAVFNDSVAVFAAPLKADWVALFDGISRGLGGFNTNVTECVDDGERTVETFQAAFDAFEDRKIFEGLHLFAEGLDDLRDALVQCNETEIVKDLVKFIEDLVSCTEDACAQFLIDVGLELVILYEHIYEIYGDIQGATNSFKIKAYEQGGICVGRVTNACITLE